VLQLFTCLFGLLKRTLPLLSFLKKDMKWLVVCVVSFKVYENLCNMLSVSHACCSKSAGKGVCKNPATVKYSKGNLNASCQFLVIDCS